MTPYCCHILPDGIRCSDTPEFEVRTTRGLLGLAGPDPYADYTHACRAHVGSLLSYQTDAVDVDEIFWEVRPLNWVQD